MRTTSKMGLTSWDKADDDYNYQQLANNWQLVDFHDHTPGRGVPIPPGGLGAGAVLKQNIAAGVIFPQMLSSTLVNTAWVTPTISSPWTAGSPTLQYMKDGNGFVHLRGNVVGNGARSNILIFQLPVGFRPGITDAYLALQTNAVAGAYLTIATTGNITATCAAASSVFVNGLTFLAEN